MAYDKPLAARVRTLLRPTSDVRERHMFGGLAFLIGGHMTCGIVGDELMLRLGTDGAKWLLRLPAPVPWTSPANPCPR